MGCILEDDENVPSSVIPNPNTVGVDSHHPVFTTPCGTITNMCIFSPFSRNISEKLKQKRRRVKSQLLRQSCLF